MKTSRLLVIGVLLSLAACGGEGRPSIARETSTVTSQSPTATPTARPDLTGLSGAQLSAKALSVLRGAGAVRISGIDEDGKATLEVDFGRTGTTAMLTTDDGYRVRLVSIGKVGYMRGSNGFWRSVGGKEGEALAAQLTGKWLKGELRDSNFSQFAEFLGLKAFVAGPLATLWPKHPAKVDVQTVNGVQCIGLRSAGLTLWVDKYTARPVSLRPEESLGELFKYTFSHYGAVPEPTAPPASLVVDDTPKAA